MDASLRTVTHGDQIVVHVAGEVDAHSVAPLRAELAALTDAGTDLVVDLTAVTFLDSTGLGVLVGALKRAHGKGGRLELVIDAERVMRVFRITALSRVFTIHRSLADALRG